MIGKIFITRTGYDPENGKHVKDPYLGDEPGLGACRPDVRRSVVPGDWIFTISGKVPRIPQYVIGGFQVAEKISAIEAYHRFPERRLRLLPDGQLAGNVIVDSDGNQHELDGHDGGPGFERRIRNYLVGTNPVGPRSPQEIMIARAETLEVLNVVFEKLGGTPFKLIGRAAKKLDEKQVCALLDWFESIKTRSSQQGRRPAMKKKANAMRLPPELALNDKYDGKAAG